MDGWTSLVPARCCHGKECELMVRPVGHMTRSTGYLHIAGALRCSKNGYIVVSSFIGFNTARI